MREKGVYASVCACTCVCTVLGEWGGGGGGGGEYISEDTYFIPERC